eukprot:6042445-Amphidinium_carterae.2
MAHANRETYNFFLGFLQFRERHVFWASCLVLWLSPESPLASSTTSCLANHLVPPTQSTTSTVLPPCRVDRLYFHLVLDHFFDDFFLVEPHQSATFAQHCLHQLFSLLGLTLDPEKRQCPTQSPVVLGVQLDLAMVPNGLLHVRAKPGRVASLTAEIHGVLDQGRLTAAQAAKLVGRADFVNTTLFGRVGRAALAELRHHQHHCPRDAAISPAVVHGLQWLLALLQLAPSRVLQLRQSSQPWLLYTDGSAESADSCKRSALGSFRSYGSAQNFLVGAVAVHPPTKRRLYCTAAVPLSVVQTWIPIGQIELFGAVLGLLTFRQEMAECDVIHSVDNDSATASLIRGSSNKSDSAKLVGLYSILAAVHRPKATRRMAPVVLTAQPLKCEAFSAVTFSWSFSILTPLAVLRTGSLNKLGSTLGFMFCHKPSRVTVLGMLLFLCLSPKSMWQNGMKLNQL